MKLTSSAFDDNGEIPCEYTCDGENLNPPLGISEVPTGTKSLVLIMDDPEVSSRSKKATAGDHWLVFNIPADFHDIEEGQEPIGTHGMVTAKKVKYHGPCPADGEHLYHFKLYALNAELAFHKKATRRRVETAMAGHVLAEAGLVGRYQMRLACQF